MDEKVDHHIGGYHLTEVIGSGGMGTVFHATVEVEGKPLPNGTKVAVKLLHPHLRAIKEFVQRFHREARLAAKIQHPNVVRVFDEGVEDNRNHFIVMELAEGLKLSDLMRDDIPLSPQQTIEIMNQTCDALVASANIDDPEQPGNARCLVHRDVKPDNIIIEALDREQFDKMTRTGDKTVLTNIHVKLLDFGLAKDVRALSTIISQTGQSLGTPAYMSPEQCSGDDVDQRSDIYSLGVCAYQMVTGTQPFPGPTPVAYAKQHGETIPPDILLRNPLCPKNLADCIYRCLAKSPGDRYATPTELKADLIRVSQGKPVAKVFRFKKPRSISAGKLAGIITATAIVILLGGAGAWYALTDRVKSNVAEAIHRADLAVAANDFITAKMILEDAVAAVAQRPDRDTLIAPARERLERIAVKAGEQKGAEDAAAVAERTELQRRDAAEAKARHERFVRYRDEGDAAYNKGDYPSARLAYEKALGEERDDRVALLLDECNEKTTPQRIAVADFSVTGDVGIADAGKAVAELLLPKLGGGPYLLVERSHLMNILAEHDFKMADVVENPALLRGNKLQGVRYLVLGSVVRLGDLAISARIVDVTSGDITRTAEATAQDARGLQSALGELAMDLTITAEERAANLLQQESEKAAQENRIAAERLQLQKLEKRFRRFSHLVGRRFKFESDSHRTLLVPSSTQPGAFSTYEATKGELVIEVTGMAEHLVIAFKVRFMVHPNREWIVDREGTIRTISEGTDERRRRNPEILRSVGKGDTNTSATLYEDEEGCTLHFYVGGSLCEIHIDDAGQITLLQNVLSYDAVFTEY